VDGIVFDSLKEEEERKKKKKDTRNFIVKGRSNNRSANKENLG
jgi:hypothetical protein